MATTDAPSEKLIERALALVVQGEVAPGDAAAEANAQLRQWREKSARHEAAVHEAVTRWNALGGLAPELRGHFQEPVTGAAPARQRQRRALLSVAALLGLGALAGKGLHWHWQQPLFAASYRTRTAQLLQVPLRDGADGAPGSRLDLAPASAIEVQLFRDRRSVRLVGGTVRFDVAADAGRPFEVLTRQARIEVVGTAFTVRDRGGAVSVSVEHGKVRVQALGGSAAPQQAPAAVELLPGHALEVRGGRMERLHGPGMESLAAWREGWLVFDNHPLAEALATINAYREQPITARDARVGALRLTGRFRATDAQGLLAALPAVLPVTATVRGDGSVELAMR